jgi:biotin carboxylase
MKKTLAAAGLPVARQALVTSGEDARRFAESVGYPIVLKPLAGLGAKNTQRVADEMALASALNTLLPTAASPCQAEEFVRGEEHTYETVFLNGEPVWSSSTFYLPGPLEVIEHAWMQYCLLLPREQAMPHVRAFHDVNARSLATLGLVNGFSHMEWFLRADGSPIVSEVGARPPGANIMPLLAAAHGADPWKAWVRLEVDRVWEFPERQAAAGCAFLRGMGVGDTIQSVRGVEECTQRIGGLIHSMKLPQIGQPHSTHYEGDGWVIVRAADTHDVVDALRTVITTIECKLG